ncbi:leucine-rich repeat protein, partial [bacterium]|nr:leucine-rich repeat protein [bacterium]
LSLNEIIFEQESSLNTIGIDSFKNTNLTSITIPESVTSIGANAFYNSPLEIVYISENTLATLNVDLSANSQSQLSYTEMSFYGSNTTVIKNINTRTKIFLESGNYTYISSDASGILTTSLIVRNDIQKVNIVSVIVGTDVKKIEAGTFSGTPKLESITINQGVNAIGRGAFYGASNLQELIYAGGMNSALTTIGIDAFKNTYSLKSTIIPQNITSIGVNAFNCNSSEVYTPSMEKIYIFKKTLDTLNVDLSANSQLSYTEMSFYGSNNVNLINPRGMTTFTLNTESVIFIDIIGELSIASYSSEIQDKNTIRSLQLGNRVTSIGRKAFYNSSLEEVNFYNIRYSKLTEIGDSAFIYSNLKKITIPASVTDIRDQAFGYTYNLDEVTFYEISNSKLKNIGWGAFYYSKKLKKITIPSSIREIGQNAFNGAEKLEKVIFYDITNVHIHIIGTHAFNGTTSLTEITLPGHINNISPVNSPKEIFKYSGLNTVYIENREGSDFNAEIQAGFNEDFYGATNVDVYTFKNKLENTANILSSSFKDLMRNKFSDYDDIFNDTMISSIDKGYLPINTIYKIQVTIPSKDLADLSEGERNSLISDIKSMYATILYVSEDELMVDLEQGSVIINISVVEPPVVAPICFPAGTPVNTDQGIICIEKLNPSKHTVDGKEIIAITQSRPIFEEIVSIKKNALSKNVPSQTTEISKEHMVCYKNKMTKACELVKICDGVDFIPYNGEILYNVLLKEHSLMMINNMKCETLHPE